METNYYYMTESFINAYDKRIIKLGITSNPKMRWKSGYSILRINFKYVFSIQCKKDDLLWFESKILFDYEIKQGRVIDNLGKSELIYLDTDYDDIKAYIYNEAIEMFGVDKVGLVLSHDEAIKIPYHNYDDDLGYCANVYEYEDTGHDINELSLDNYIQTEYVRNLKQEYEGKLVVEEQFKLRGYQKNAYEELCEYIEEYKSARLYIMCRCGKTVLFQRYAVEHRKQYDIIIYAAPRLSLINDVKDRFHKIFTNLDYKIFEVSSSDAGKATKIVDIHKAIINKENVLIFVCNDSYYKLKSTCKDKNILVIFDEAHHLNEQLTAMHPMRNALTGNVHYIFATATPSEGPYLTDELTCYNNDPRYFGPNENVISFYDVEEAMNDKFISPAKIVIADYELENLEQIEQEMKQDLNPLVITHITYKLYQRLRRSHKILKDLSTHENKPKKILAYTNNINEIEFAESYAKKYMSEYKVLSLHSLIRNNITKDIVQEFRKCKDNIILVNCRMLTDGIDIQDLDTVIFLSPKNQKQEIIQCMFRPRSYAVGKLAYIIIPQVLNSNNVDDLKSNEQYECILNVFRELYYLNDPYVRKLVKNRSTWGNSNANNEKKENAAFEMFICSDNVKAKLLELTNNYIVKKCATYGEAILFIMNDYIPRSFADIAQRIELLHIEINERYVENGVVYYRDGKMYDGDDYYDGYENIYVEAEMVCNELLRNGLIKYNEEYKVYYLERPIKERLTTDEFIKLLLKQGITTETEYRSMYCNSYNDVYHSNPIAHYRGFKWEVLLKNVMRNDVEYYSTIDEVRNAIDVIINSGLLGDLGKFKDSPSDVKLKKLNELDPKIRRDLVKSYQIRDIECVHDIFISYVRLRE